MRALRSRSTTVKCGMAAATASRLRALVMPARSSGSSSSLSALRSAPVAGRMPCACAQASDSHAVLA
jgi:hypothetical protein